MNNAFLKKFGAKSVYYNLDPTAKNSGMIETKDWKLALAKNAEGSDIYFYINGGPKEFDVTSFQACHIDLDSGRDEDGKYFSTKAVNRCKLAMMLKIKEFPLKPSLIVETRNGYQVYWLLTKASRDKELWKGVESRLVTYFTDVGSDKRTIKPNQLYRVPGTYWMKKTEGKQKFYCSVVFQSPKRHSLEEFKEVFSDLNVPAHSRCAVVASKAASVSYTKPWAATSSQTTTTPNSCVNEVIQFLDQVVLPLNISKNQFLAKCAKELATKLSNENCIQ